MREIKFRVWNKKYKRWLTDNDYGTHCSSNWMMDIFTGKIVDFVNSNQYYSPQYDPGYYTVGMEVVKESPYVIQQYTGLKDKNNKEIYEGDVLLINWLGLPEYTDDVCWMPKTLTWYPTGVLTTEISSDYSFEVVGNIFETPELMGRPQLKNDIRI